MALDHVHVRPMDCSAIAASSSASHP